MAYCEKCGQKGYEPQQMRVDEANRQFLGPCCAKVVEIAPPIGTVKTDEVDYGIELSKSMGLRAYVAYGGLSLQFKRTPVELKDQWDRTVTDSMTAA